MSRGDRGRGGGRGSIAQSATESNRRSYVRQSPQALHGLAPKCKLINMHELINKSTNNYVTLLPSENGVIVNTKE